MHSHVNGSGAKRRQFRKQLPPIQGVAVVGLVITEVRPNWSERSIGSVRVHIDLHSLQGFLRPGGHAENEKREQNNRAEALARLRTRC